MLKIFEIRGRIGNFHIIMFFMDKILKYIEGQFDRFITTMFKAYCFATLRLFWNFIVKL